MFQSFLSLKQWCFSSLHLSLSFFFPLRSLFISVAVHIYPHLSYLPYFLTSSLINFLAVSSCIFYYILSFLPPVSQFSSFFLLLCIFSSLFKSETAGNLYIALFSMKRKEYRLDIFLTILSAEKTKRFVLT